AITSTANIAEEPTPAAGTVIAGVETVPLTTEERPQGTGGLFSTAGCTSTINWGDGTTSTGTLSDPDANGVFTVTGSHTYIEDGEVEVDLVDAFPVTTTVNSPGMPAIAVTNTANIAEEPTPAGGTVIVGVETVPL